MKKADTKKQKVLSENKLKFLFSELRKSQKTLSESKNVLNESLVKEFLEEAVTYQSLLIKEDN